MRISGELILDVLASRGDHRQRHVEFAWPNTLAYLR